MKTMRDDEIRIATEAARWQRTLETADSQVLAEFADWVKASPRHLREFMFMEALESAARGIDPLKKIDIDVNFAADDENIAVLSGPMTKPVRARGGWRLPAAIAAGMLVMALGLIWQLVPGMLGGWEHHSTPVGEQRAFELADGSVVQLNARSHLQVRFNSERRDLKLVSGEALFKVAQDRLRPFQVQAGNATIRAIGTQFNVHRRASDTMVTVLEGKVQIDPSPNESSPEYLSSGEAAKIETDGALVRDTRATVADAVAWRQRRLVFREETLATIADEFNRYNKDTQMVIEGDSARARRFGGTFDADNTESLIQFVARSGDFEIEREKGRIVIRMRQ